MPTRMTTADRRASEIDPHATLLAIRLFFILLISGDLVFIAMHVGHITTPALRGAHYSLETDGGLAEFYQYMKQFWLTLCLATAYFQRRETPFLCWSGLSDSCFWTMRGSCTSERDSGWGRRWGCPRSLVSVPTISAS
jgi:hypothetical protein